MLGPICRYSAMPKIPKQDAKPIQYCGLEDGEEEPNPDAEWFRASKQLEMGVRSGAQEVMVHIQGQQSWKYIHHKGIVEQDGSTVYKHCNLKHPDIWFEYVGTKVVGLQAIGLDADGKWKCAVVSQVSGEVLTNIILNPAKTIAFARAQIEDRMKEEGLLPKKSILKILTFDACSSHSKLKSSSLKPTMEACAKRMKLL